MADNLNDPGPQDGKLIALDEPWELARWCGALKVTPGRLEEAVSHVGHSAVAVREWLAAQPDEVDPQGE
jgi:hypothetical protein